MFLHRTIGITPNGLSLVRIFLTPWITLLLIETLARGSVSLAVASVSLYALVALTDLFDGPLARALVAEEPHSHDVGYGGALDRISDKLLIVFSLVPFGANPFLVAIIIGESALLYQALHATSTKKKQATYIGKIKMNLQTLLMPILLFAHLSGGEGIAMFSFWYAGLSALFTFLSVWSHFRSSAA